MNDPEPTPHMRSEETPDQIIDHAPLAEDEPPPTAAAPRKGRGGLITTIVVVVLAAIGGGGYWVWQNPDAIPGLAIPGLALPGTAPRAVVAAGAGTSGGADLAGLKQQVADLAARVSKLESAPPPPTVAAAPAAPAVDVKAIEARLAALEQRPAPVAAPVAAAAGVGAAEVAALRSQIASDNQKISSLAQTVQALTDQVQGSDRQTSQKLQALQGQVETSDKLSSQVSGQISGLAARAAKLTQVQAASAALAAGKPLGTISDAPPSLARYAAAAPPTEAGLRLSYPDIAAQAMAAAQPETGEKPFLDRVWNRMQQAVTVRAGERVIVGNPAAAILTQAQDRLDAGDLAGAVAALKKLPPDAAAPLSDWMSQASALLAARAALADLAAHA